MMLRISALSRVYLRVPIVVDEINGQTLDPTLDTAEIALVAQGTTVADGDFHSATWSTTVAAGTTYDAVTVLIGPGGSPSLGTYTAGFYDVYVRMTDTPEKPVLFAGTVQVY